MGYERFVDKHQKKIWACIVHVRREYGPIRAEWVESLFRMYFPKSDITATQIRKSIARFEKRFQPVIIRTSRDWTKEYESFRTLPPEIPFLWKIRFAFSEWVYEKKIAWELYPWK